MKLPFISCICITYARVEQLQEALHCFLDQNYQGQKELIILNTFPDQVLKFDHPEVTICNLGAQPATMGEMRNIAISLSKGQLIVTWDDDDIYLPNHLTNFMKMGYSHDSGLWLRQDKQFFMEKGILKQITAGTPNTFAFTRHQFSSVGGYKHMNTGEDHDFISRVTSIFAGSTIELRDSETSFIYCWGQGIYHVSGQGSDEEAGTSATQRVAQWTRQRVKAGHIRTGAITLFPGLKRDYWALTRKKLGIQTAACEHRRGKIGIVLLGRYGDVLNILPVAHYIEKHLSRPYFFISREFASVLDNVSYVIPQPMELRYDQINEAVRVAKQRCELVIVAQVWGAEYRIEKNQPAYNMESWRLAGFLPEFHRTEEFPLVLDRRNRDAEKLLVQQHVKHPSRPTLLLNLTGGHSSPFERGRSMQNYIIEEFGQRFDVIDLSKITAPNISHLLGLYDVADLLITTDTATLHLATASQIPVIALTNDKEWLGSMPRCNCIARIPYDKVISSMENIYRLIRMVSTHQIVTPEYYLPLAHKPARRIFHAFEVHEDKNQYSAERRMRAMNSWRAIYEQGVIACPYREYKRTAKSELGDPRDLPYLKDVLANAMEKANDEDIIFWTNDDNGLHPQLPAMLRTFVTLYEAGSSFRCEFKKEMPSFTEPPERFAELSEAHIGRDLFVATKKWWSFFWDDIPDFILGAPEFDLCIAALIRLNKGYIISRKNVEQVVPCCELPKGYVTHEYHVAKWSVIDQSTPSIVHNRRLFKEWAAKNIPELKFHGDGTI